MQREVRYRRHTDEQDALLLAWVLILGVLGIGYFIVWDRLHVRPAQLIEMTIYPLLVLVFLWEVLRYRATRISKMETAWPRPIPHVTRRQDERQPRRSAPQFLGPARLRHLRGAFLLVGQDADHAVERLWDDRGRQNESARNRHRAGHRSRRAHHLHRRQRRQEAPDGTASLD